MVARKPTNIQTKCNLSAQYLERLTELTALQLLNRRQHEYITTPLGREWLHHHYALMRLTTSKKSSDIKVLIE